MIASTWSATRSITCRSWERAAYLKQALQEKLIDHKHYIAQHGDDMPAISGWRWGRKGGAAGRDTAADNV